MKGLSVIIPSYNTKEITLRCIGLLEATLKENDIPFEIIVIDNASQDGSPAELRKIRSSHIRVALNRTNIGYGKANNQGIDMATYKYILFLNSDVLLHEKVNFAQLLAYMDKHEKIGALTVRVSLTTGSIDPASHRGFPTLWRSFCYFSKLERLFGSTPILNKIFGGYHLTYLDLNTIHEIDSPTGAFYLTRLSILKELKGFDSDFFMYGEDLDLSFRIKQLGMQVLYYPKYNVTHYKYQSGLKSKYGAVQRSKTRKYFYEAMATFYRKHYAASHWGIVNRFVYFAINLKYKLI